MCRVSAMLASSNRVVHTCRTWSGLVGQLLLQAHGRITPECSTLTTGKAVRGLSLRIPGGECHICCTCSHVMIQAGLLLHTKQLSASYTHMVWPACTTSQQQWHSKLLDALACLCCRVCQMVAAHTAICQSHNPRKSRFTTQLL